jgi:hypothetical protein
MFIAAHFDGHQILLDEPISLKPETRLRIEILDDGQSLEQERLEWTRSALANFALLYEDEPDIYTEADIIELNPNYRDPWKDSLD